MGFVADEDGIEIGEDFEVCDDFVDLKIPDLKCRVVSVNAEHGYRLLLSSQIERILLLAVLEDSDDFVVRKLGELLRS